MVIEKIELVGDYKVTVENREDAQKTIMGVAGFALKFSTKQDVENHIKLLNKALEFWEFD